MNRDNSYLIGNRHAVGSGPNTTSFKAGSSPWNKGKRGYMGANRTSFKPGMVSARRVEVGTVTIRRDKNGKHRRHIKTATGWTEYAKHLWIEAAGFLADGDVVHHIDGDSLGDRLDNLIAIPREYHPQIHSRWGIKPPTAEMMDRVAKVYPLIAVKRLAQEVLAL